LLSGLRAKPEALALRCQAFRRRYRATSTYEKALEEA
jgi:hypothetical protein